MITQKEREYLRRLAGRQREIAESENNRTLEKRWKRHNQLESEQPLMVIEIETFWDDVKPDFFCENPDARAMEERIQMLLTAHDLIGDDRVIPDFHAVPLTVHTDNFGIALEKETPRETGGIAYQYRHPITDLSRDLSKLRPSHFSHQLQEARRQADLAEEVFGDLLPVRIENNSLLWYTGLTQRVVELMGMENYFLAMYDTPDELHEMMRFLTDDVIRYIRWQESEGILTPNWGCQYAGSSNFGFTDQLPSHPVSNTDLRKGKTDVHMEDLWLNTNSQETVGISRDMFEEFVLPYYREICKEAGLVYYGCCEPVHDIFSGGLDTLPHLRKLSVSPWCNEESIGEQLQGKGVIYSRKPSPNFLGVVPELDEEAFCNHIRRTLRAAKGLELEMIFRDIYTVKGNPQKLHRAVKLVRRCIEEV